MHHAKVAVLMYPTKNGSLSAKGTKTAASELSFAFSEASRLG
jgi:hypothetical protein